MTIHPSTRCARSGRAGFPARRTSYAYVFVRGQSGNEAREDTQRGEGKEQNGGERGGGEDDTADDARHFARA